MFIPIPATSFQSSQEKKHSKISVLSMSISNENNDGTRNEMIILSVEICIVLQYS